MLNWLLNHLLFAGTMFFAAGTPALGGEGGGYEGLDAGGAGDADSGALGDGGGIDAGTDTADADLLDESRRDLDDAAAKSAQTDQQKPKIEEDPDAKPFTGAVSGRIRAMVKAAPELGQVLQKYPEIKNAIEASFRERAAYKELAPTIAELRQLRDELPNGLADLKVLQDDIQEIEQLDNAFYTRDAVGRYPGHSEIIGNMYSDDPQAAISLFRTLPKEWARLDPDSYNDVMGQIVGATVSSKQWMERLGEIRQFVADGGDAKQAVAAMERIEREMLGYRQGKAKPSEEEERLAQREQEFNQRTQQNSRQEQARFHQNFLSESKKLQMTTITAHPAMQRLQKLVESKAMTSEKFQKIADEIRGRMERFLAKSPSFMRKLRPAHANRNLDETLSLQKAAWSQPWLLNRMVREVLRVETPAMVSQQNRGAQRRPVQQQKTPAKPAAEQRQRTAPYQENGRWYRPNGSPFTTSEVLSGKHLQS